MDEKYLTGIEQSSKSRIFEYINKENSHLRIPPDDCCGEYQAALRACLSQAGYDWLVLQSAGIAALWAGIQMTMDAYDCIYEAEDNFSSCC